MEDRRAQLQSKLNSLAADGAELFHHHHQQQQQQKLSVTSRSKPHPGSSTSSSTNQLIVDLAEDTIDVATALLDLWDHRRDDLHDHIDEPLDQMFTVLDPVSPNSCHSALHTCSVKSTSTSRPSDYIVKFLIAFCGVFCVVAIWFDEIWSAMFLVSLVSLVC